MNIIEAMKERRSVRTFDNVPLTPDTLHLLQQYIDHVDDPFGGNFIIHLKKFDIENGFKPSTYGMIKGAREFFTIAMADDDKSALAVGFCFEQIVLKAWQLGLGTCWIAATFKGTCFDSASPLPDGLRLRIVCPVGVTASKSLIEKISRFAVKSDRRKPFDKLFFDGNFTQSLSPDSRFGESLEMMRLAPSSTNSQPWRAIVDGDEVHFYYVPKSQLSILDCGIGLCHFAESEKNAGHQVQFYHSTTPPAAPKNLRYLLSYRPIPADFPHS